MSLVQKKYDFLIIGGGIIGLSLARELKKRHPQASCALIDKEKTCHAHASGRNSGVLHAGFYYSASSLKARFCKLGHQLLKNYCEEQNIPVLTCGKLVVAKNEHELAGLNELLRRAQANGVQLHLISKQEAEEIEPRALTFEKALFSPTTACVDPIVVLQTLHREVQQQGVDVGMDTCYLHKTEDGIVTSKGKLQANFIINAAGLYADQIALDFGHSKSHRILPFKGLYLYSSEPVGALRTHIYPVPDLNYPFLGVHFTLTHSGQVKIGPTAIPALWREQYQGLSGFKPHEFWDIIKRQASLLWKAPFDFKKLAFEEMQKYLSCKMVKIASHLVKDVHPSQYRVWGKAGIRAQLLNISTNQLETDFLIESDSHSLHILNAVSPGFTSALSFAQFVADRVEQQLCCS
ncbi:MAG: L-2-hydroxyglutarate oxidase [Verrucomicrobia bacterium]|nr:L-2-hydroxyglutarate oxidase [Verrucomicrobiota bacterium]MBS0645947.1 L-2-hydroxyglutarate oxidase [Verrucomicrobiota bacterium]